LQRIIFWAPELKIRKVGFFLQQHLFRHKRRFIVTFASSQATVEGKHSFMNCDELRQTKQQIPSADRQALTTCGRSQAQRSRRR